MAKIINSDTHAWEVTETGVLAVTIVQPGESLEPKPGTTVVEIKSAP